MHRVREKEIVKDIRYLLATSVETFPFLFSAAEPVRYCSIYIFQFTLDIHIDGLKSSAQQQHTKTDEKEKATLRCFQMLIARQCCCCSVRRVHDIQKASGYAKAVERTQKKEKRRKNTRIFFPFAFLSSSAIAAIIAF